MNEYAALKQRQQEEINAFPMMFAFSNKQFSEGMAKLGLNVDDTDKIYRLGNTGGYIRKTDSEALHQLMAKHDKELNDAIAADKTGEGFIFQMFNYELANHEYNYTGDLEDTLDALDYTPDQINADKRLRHGLTKAVEHQRKRGA